MIGIIGAMKKETAELISAITEAKTEVIAGMEFVSGKLDGASVAIATCGPGKVFAGICTQAMIMRYEPSLIINSGIAGAISPELCIGDVAIADNVCQYDMDTSACGDPVGMISMINKTYFPCDKAALDAVAAAVAEADVAYKVGTIATGDRFVADSAEKARISSLFHAISCEMEGGAIGHACYINDVPFLVVRVISDEANGNAPKNYEEYANAAAKKSSDIIRRAMQKLSAAK